MNYYPLQLSFELMQEVRRLAEVNQMPLDQWFISVIAQKVEVERSLGQLRLAAQGVDYGRFDEILARVPDVEPMPGDEL